MVLEAIGFGVNRCFQLGTNAVGGSKPATPQPISFACLEKGDRPCVLKAGYNHSVMLSQKGKLYRWGFDKNRVYSAPTLMPLNSGRCISIACGRKHTIALIEDGSGTHVYASGTGYFGQLGHGDNCSYSDLRVIPTLEPTRIGEQVVSIAAGGHHSIAVTASGRVFAWGFNRYGQCGEGSCENAVCEPSAMVLDAIQRGDIVVSAACGRHHSVVMTARGRVYTCGASSYGRLGLADVKVKNHLTLQEVVYFNENPAKQISCGDMHVLALTRSAEVYSWGYGAEGQMGHGGPLHVHTPRKVELPIEGPVKQVECGSVWSMALMHDGRCLAWGCADGGWTGLDTPTNAPFVEQGLIPPGSRYSATVGFDSKHNALLPEVVNSLSDWCVESISCGGGHTLVLANRRVVESRVVLPTLPKALSAAIVAEADSKRSRSKTDSTAVETCAQLERRRSFAPGHTAIWVGQ